METTNIKTVLFNAEQNGKTNTEYKVFLSFDEIERTKEIQTLNTDWKIARDWLVLDYYLGQRAYDLLKIMKGMIYTKIDSDGNSFRFIEIAQQKTDEKVVISLHDEVKKKNEIVETEKYNLVSSLVCRRSFATIFTETNYLQHLN